MAIMFTVHADINDFVSPALIGAIGTVVHFDLQSEDLIRATGSAPMLIDYQRTTGYIRSDGKMYDRLAVSASPFDLDDPGTIGVRLLANDPDFNMESGLAYVVSFEHIWQGRGSALRPFRAMIAPSKDTIVNLAEILAD